MKCPHCNKDVADQLIVSWSAHIIGKRRSKAKTKASRANASKPPRDGSRPRGRPVKTATSASKEQP